MERRAIQDEEAEVEISAEQTGTGPRLRIRSVGTGGRSVALDPLELEGLTRLPFVAFTALPGAQDVAEETVFGPPREDMDILRNEFAMVGVSVVEAPEGPRLHVRNMASGAEVRLRAGHLDQLTRLRHRDLAPLVDPSGLVVQEEPDPDQV